MVAERTGVWEESLSWSGALPLARVRALLEERHPGLSGVPYRIAVDQEFVDDSTPVRSGAELALLPPFSGG
ncbi:MAG: MoaD/ThiS family protein [Gemmatimonadales bacterium]|nr:MAG: MoaD/ThiS family protein [Gemmatimonadales bacterium]